MTNTRDLIIRLKEVREEKGNPSYDVIRKMIEDTGVIAPAKATLSRVFADGSEDEAENFSYDKTLVPIANALLDVEVDEESDNLDTRALKALLKSKKEHMDLLKQRVLELETALDKEKIKYNEKLEKEREQSRNSIEFLKHQVELKDKRMDMLFEAIFLKNDQHKELREAVRSCPLRKEEG